jgi:hypothetical protein
VSGGHIIAWAVVALTLIVAVFGAIKAIGDLMFDRPPRIERDETTPPKDSP